jgi:hypothetical protein
MLNVINGFYHPQEGTITFRGKAQTDAPLRGGGNQGIARTFQNVALFKGMSTLDNIMSGRTLKMHRNIFWQAQCGRAGGDEEIEHRLQGRGDHRLPRDPAHPQDPGRASCPTACRSGSNSAARWPPSRICCCSTSRWRA